MSNKVIDMQKSNLLQIAVGLMLVLSILSVSAFAQGCSDVTFTSSKSSYELNEEVTVKLNPNLTVATSTHTQELINIPYTFTVNVTNEGDENASEVVIRLDPLDDNATFTPSNVSLGSLGLGETKTATFTVTSPKEFSEVLNIIVDYKDQSAASFNIVDSRNFTVTGFSLPSVPDNYLLIGGPKSQQTVNFVAGTPQTLSSTAVGLNLTLNTTENVNSPEITLSKFSSISSVTSTVPSGKLSATRFLDIAMNDSFETKLVFPAEIKVFYQQSEVDSNNINDGSLKLYAWNGSVWELLTSVDDKASNVVTAQATHFSVFGLFGEEKPASSSSSGSGGGGGGGGTITTQPKACSDSDYSFGEWSSCANGQQTRTGSKSGTCTGDATKTETQSCTIQLSACSDSDYSWGSWSECSNGQQTRTGSKSGSCDGADSKTATQSCQSAPTPTVTQLEGVEFTGGGISGLFVGRTQLSQLSGKAGDSASFKLAEENHTLTIREVGTDFAVIWIQSDTLEVRLNLGQTKLLNIDGKQGEDIAVSLVSIKDGVATLTVEQLGGSATGSVAMGVVVLIVLIIVAFALYRRRDKDKFKITIKRQDKKIQL